ncbi:opioid growth factor receptor-like isoform X2 [Pseudorasbora parva]|uniref:opioid growth factor receptor-like isoform X2 n=1 Tax=Pseudorasbora parva TaxID=51549 RepID=UPI00351E61F2
MESDNECEFDSTWENDYDNKTPRKKVFKRMSRRNIHAAKDMQDFRHSILDLDYDPGQGRFYNLEFYHGRIKSSPDDVHIDEFHKKWLFPIQERGVNWNAQVLTKMEIKLFRDDEAAKMKLVKSYKLMLDFYGIRLVNEKTGEVKRTDNWKERFSNLNRYSHNNLRITRILKCLGTLGLQHYQAPLVKFFLHETLVEGNLQNVKQSVLDYFMFAVLDKSERRELVRYAFYNFKPREQFVWGPKKFLIHLPQSRFQHEQNEQPARAPSSWGRTGHTSKGKTVKLWGFSSSHRSRR